LRGGEGGEGARWMDEWQVREGRRAFKRAGAVGLKYYNMSSMAIALLKARQPSLPRVQYTA